VRPHSRWHHPSLVPASETSWGQTASVPSPSLPGPWSRAPTETPISSQVTNASWCCQVRLLSRGPHQEMLPGLPSPAEGWGAAALLGVTNDSHTPPRSRGDKCFCGVCPARKDVAGWVALFSSFAQQGGSWLCIVCVLTLKSSKMTPSAWNRPLETDARPLPSVI
jgi:hypothetical protein